jgi:hypothetical protein
MLAFLMRALCLSFDFYIEFAEVEYKMVAIGPVLTLLEAVGWSCRRTPYYGDRWFL